MHKIISAARSRTRSGLNATGHRCPGGVVASLLALLTVTSIIFTSGTAYAQSDEEGEWEEEQESSEEALDADTEVPDEDNAPATPEDTSSPPDSKNRGSGIYEDPDETYLFVGARYRMQLVPQFVQNWFAEGGDTLWVNTPGIEFAVRQDGFEYNFFGMLGLYSMTDVPFKGNSDEELAWETITADYQVLFVGADFLWSTSEFSPGLSMVYGAGIGLGAVFGEMTRTQAYPQGDTYLPCAQPGIPNPVYCDGTNNHYNGYPEPSWLDGGSSPLVFPWIAGQVGLRYKFHRNFVARLETGVTVTSLFFGLGADYGL